MKFTFQLPALLLERGHFQFSTQNYLDCLGILCESNNAMYIVFNKCTVNGLRLQANVASAVLTCTT